MFTNVRGPTEWAQDGGFCLLVWITELSRFNSDFVPLDALLDMGPNHRFGSVLCQNPMSEQSTKYTHASQPGSEGTSVCKQLSTELN